MAWYAVYTRSRAEKKLANQLQTLGVESYLPLKKELRTWTDRKKWVEFPAINGYLFVNIVESQRNILFNSSYFVAFVRAFGEAAIIPASQIDLMRKTVEQNIPFTLETNKLVVGSNVRILTPPFENIEGIITKTTTKNRIYITLQGTDLSIVIDADRFDIEPIDAFITIADEDKSS